jgi:CHAT domain-containing protein
MKKFLLLFSFFITTICEAQEPVADSVSSAGGEIKIENWNFNNPEEYDQSDFIYAKADQFYVSVEHKPDSLEQLTWRTVQRHLGRGEIFIDFMYTDFNEKPTFLTSVIRSEHWPSVVVIPKIGGSKSNIRASQAVNRGIEAGDAQSGYMAYNNLMAYLEPQLEGIKTIYYSSSNDLNLVNLKFLKCKDGKYLFEKYQLVRLHSGASFVGNKHRIGFPKKMKVLLVGDVAYECDGSAADNPETYEHFWDHLPGSRTEIRNISSILKPAHQVDVLDSCKATEERFVAQVNKTRYDIIHLATHGFFFKGANSRYRLASDAYPLLFAGIVLSGANNKQASVDPGNDMGMFTAMDFKKLDVANIRLVVLSTCHSGDGQATHSSAPFGLMLAMLRQGVQAMVLSNRAIPDQETTIFMTTFYKNLARIPDADLAFTATLRELKTSKPNVDWSFMDMVH